MSVLLGKTSAISGSSMSGNGDLAGPSCVSESSEKLFRQLSLASVYPHDEDEEFNGDEQESLEDSKSPLSLGPLLPLKQQLEKDKEDESLKRWKEQLLGRIQLDSIEEGVDPEVTLMSLIIMSEARPDIVVQLPLTSNYKSHLFTLKEGSVYNLKFTFVVRRNIVSGLTYVHTVWKNGIRVDNSRVMLGTFAPQVEPYMVVMEEETTPSGMLARGNYTAKTKFIDDDGRCHLEIEHAFDIRKEW